MCMGGSKPPPPPPPPPPPQVTPAPARADEENRRAVDEQLDLLRRRQGRESTNLTGGLGDTGFGSSVVSQSSAAGRTTLGGL